MNTANAKCILRRDCGESAHAVGAQNGYGFYISLNAGSATGIGCRDSQNFIHE
jgi:hypothetical protein